jgi:hypothetical protein
VAAPGLPDVLIGDADELVSCRVGGHLLDQPPVALLNVMVIVQAALDVLEARGERVANPLQLVHREDARPPDAGDAELDSGAGEGRAEEPAQLRLHGGDLPPKVDAGGALVVLVESGIETDGRRGGKVGQVLLGRELDLKNI